MFFNPRAKNPIRRGIAGLVVLEPVQLQFVFSEYPWDQSFDPFSVSAVILSQVLKQHLFLDGYTKAVGSQRTDNDR